ncbi:MAG: PorT family protein [Pedobacter sp.]|nr:MAG: PorT family protein [Pedobacter sp.]
MIKKVSLIISLFMVTFTAFAQNWGGGVDDEDLHFGFSFQYISAEYKILKKNNWQQLFFDTQNNNIPINGKLQSISSIPTMGFGIGGLLNKRINNYFDARISPMFIFSDRIVRYQYENNSSAIEDVTLQNLNNIIDKKIQATLLEMPISIKIKSNQLNNIRTYFQVGAKYSLDIGSKKKNFDEGEMPINKLLKNKRSYFSYETAAGLDFYFEYFKTSTEIKYSFSTSSVLKDDDTPFANPIDKLFLRHLTVSLILQ